MVIDIILDRKGWEEDGRKDWYNIYRLRNIYDYAVANGWDYLASAIDCGTEEDIQNALCIYIDMNDYNPELKDYIRSVKWDVHELPIYNIQSRKEK